MLQGNMILNYQWMELPFNPVTRPDIGAVPPAYPFSDIFKFMLGMFPNDVQKPHACYTDLLTVN